MATAVHFITIFTMLTHAVVGCCWHHDHETACNAHDAAAIEHDGHAHGNCHSEALDAGDDNHRTETLGVRAAHEHDSVCSAAKCTFLKTQPRSWCIAPVVSAFDGIIAADSTSAALRTNRAARVGTTLSRDSAVSVCAQLQVWVI